ncbi:MAG: hypothetical protein AAGA85_23695 [Bacteroidota bacterium]
MMIQHLWSDFRTYSLTLFIVLAFSLLFPYAGSAQKAHPIRFGGMHFDTCHYRGEEASYRIPAKPRIQQMLEAQTQMSSAQRAELANLKTAEIIFEFGDGFALLGPEEQAAKDAFEFAASIWEMEVVSTVPIVISADFFPLTGGTIGFNGSPTVTGVPGTPDPSVAYTSALANSIAGFDLLPGQPDGEQGYNSNFEFYFGTDGNTPPGVLDFATVILHEIGHSMGIFGRSNGGAGVGENGGANPTTWDLLVELGDGTPILDLGFGTPEQQDALVGGDLFINGPLATAALGGIRPEIWAPNPFQGGSSFSHWDEIVFPGGDPNSLMTPFAESGASNFNIGDITRGVLSDQGWTLASELETADVGVVALEAPVSSSDLLAGESVQVLIRNFGIEPVSGFEVTYILDGGDPVTELVEFEIPPVSAASFVFATTVDLDEDGRTYEFQLFTDL